MKKTILACYFLIALSTSGFAQTATSKIDVDRVVSEIDPKIYGVFMEPIHFNGRRMGLPDSVEFNTLYGNLYDLQSPLADENGFRKDYIEAMHELKITNMRWPGGNFLMGYDWKDGIGPKEQRPTRINLAWGGPETNQVGTDEWMALNRSIGSENIVCVNLGLGSILDAAYWVEYCNYNKGSTYSDLRVKNGHRDPYNVKLWDLGNEVDGLPWELGHKNAEDYVETAREAAKAIKSVDPPVFMSVLPIAQCLNSFVRHADVVKMANFTMLTSLLSNGPRNGTFKSPVFYTFKLFSNNCLGSSVDAFVACDTFGTDKYKSIPYLDVTAVYAKASGALYINVINRHQSNAIPADITAATGEFSGKAEATVINSDDLKAPFSYDKRSQYGPVPGSVKLNGNKRQYAFPPHSFTQIKVTINRRK